MTVLEQMRETQTPKDSSRPYNRLAAARDEIIKNNEERDNDGPAQIYYYVEVRKK